MKTLNKYCPICRRVAAPSMKGLTDYWFCRNCKLGWVKKIHDVEYDESYYQSGNSVLSKLFLPIEQLFLYIRKSYGGHSLKNLWVDVGAGEGKFLEKVNASYKIGVEVSVVGRQIMSIKGFKIMKENEFLRKRGLDAQVISFWQALEHIENPLKYINVAAKNISPHGKLVVAVPNIDSIEFATFNKYWFHLAPGLHLWFFSPESLSLLLNKNGWVVDTIDYVSLEHSFAGTLQSFINISTNSDNILHKLVKRKQDLGSVTTYQIILVVFWCTLGLPIVLILWITGIIMKRPGTFILVASKINV